MKFHFIKAVDILTSPSAHTAQQGETKVLSNGPGLVEELVELALLKCLLQSPIPSLISQLRGGEGLFVMQQEFNFAIIYAKSLN